jgi:hypothetical protein
MKTLLRVFLLLLFAIILIPVGLYHFIMSRLATRRRPARPVSDADIARAEKLLGFPLPEPLGTLFRGPRGALAARRASLFGPVAAAKEYRMLTKQPYGPNGEAWPANLLPFAGFEPGYACFDRDSGAVVEWDPEELAEGNESRAAWKRSFVPTGLALTDWLKGAAASA